MGPESIVKASLLDYRQMSPSQRLTASILEGLSTQYLKDSVPKTIPILVFGTRVLEY